MNLFFISDAARAAPTAPFAPLTAVLPAILAPVTAPLLNAAALLAAVLAVRLGEPASRPDTIEGICQQTKAQMPQVAITPVKEYKSLVSTCMVMLFSTCVVTPKTACIAAIFMPAAGMAPIAFQIGKMCIY